MNGRRGVFVAVGLVVGLAFGAVANIIVGDLGVAIRDFETRGDLPYGWLILRLMTHLLLVLIGAGLGWRWSSIPTDPGTIRYRDFWLVLGIPISRRIFVYLLAAVVGGIVTLMVQILYPQIVPDWIIGKDPLGNSSTSILTER